MMFNWSDLLSVERSRAKSTVTKASLDNRSDFKKDYDTICNCTGLRRLQDKAQVFPLEKGDYARTRLTHSIEVMSIVESIGQSIIPKIMEDDTAENCRDRVSDIPMLMKAAAL